MKLGKVTLAADGQSVTYAGSRNLYTIVIGQMYAPKASQAISASGERSNLVVVGFVPATEHNEVLVIVNYTKHGGRTRRQTAIPVSNVTQNYAVPSVPRLTPPKPREAKPDDEIGLAAKLVAQLVADVADLRARVSSLENSRRAV